MLLTDDGRSAFSWRILYSRVTTYRGTGQRRRRKHDKGGVCVGGGTLFFLVCAGGEHTLKWGKKMEDAKAQFLYLFKAEGGREWERGSMVFEMKYQYLLASSHPFIKYIHNGGRGVVIWMYTNPPLRSSLPLPPPPPGRMLVNNNFRHGKTRCSIVPLGQLSSTRLDGTTTMMGEINEPLGKSN